MECANTRSCRHQHGEAEAMISGLGIVIISNQRCLAGKAEHHAMPQLLPFRLWLGYVVLLFLK